ncbi:uncharacterized protein LOC127252915 [Andrographis paniculata]|uniref:uncharacterized protein LOC127252915 n=1 Tax=Andrographis paniculata TaxID=175694 RepID=UPI0021E96EA2|nr:uncharacterized protein LOC127252915 [Andrographis paniculata]
MWNIVDVPPGKKPISCKWLLQLDVKNVFFHGDLTEEVYMTFPRGSDFLGKHDFFASSYDSALFIRRSPTRIIILLLYVNDMVITGDDTYGLTDSQIAPIPLEVNYRLDPFDGTPLENPSRYRQLVGSLIYLTGILLHGLHFSADSSLVLVSFSDAD